MAPALEYKNLRRLAESDPDVAAHIYEAVPFSMLSRQEVAYIYLYMALQFKNVGAICELGTYIGGSTVVMAKGIELQKGTDATIEVYDFFKHNPTSRRRLAKHPLYSPEDFYEIWADNTSAYEKYIDLRRGDLRKTAAERSGPVEFLYVDIIKHESLLAPLHQHFVSRLTTGSGILFHQDYFHWQSPYVVYGTEYLMDGLEGLGSLGNNAMVFRKVKDLPETITQCDLAETLSWREKMELMDRALARFSGHRLALLRVSRLNLGLDSEEFDAVGEANDIVSSTNSKRVKRYVDGVMKRLEPVRAGKGRQMW